MRNRITGAGTADPTQLLANPSNWRMHPEHQQRALEGALREIGWTETVLVNERSGHVVDGHLRVELALRRGDQEIPVTYIDLPEEEERLVLATLDPMAGYAETDEQAARDLLEQIQVGDADLQQYLAERASDLNGPTGEGTDLTQPVPFERSTVLDARQGAWQNRKRAWGHHFPSTKHGLDDWKAAHGGSLPGEDGGSEYSISDPALYEAIYQWFCPPQGRILDPFAGSCAPGMVATWRGHTFQGIELREEQVEENRSIASQIFPDQGPQWHHGPAQDMEDLAPGPHDLIASCPPYADLEVYSDDPDDISTMEYRQFLESYRQIIHGAADQLAEDRYCVWIVSEVRDRKGIYRDLVGDTIRASEAAGLRVVTDAIYITPMGSLAMRAGHAFQATRKLGRAHQNVIVCAKGNPEGTL